MCNLYMSQYLLNYYHTDLLKAFFIPAFYEFTFKLSYLEVNNRLIIVNLVTDSLYTASADVFSVI